MYYNGFKLKCDFGTAEAIGQLLIWLVLVIVTFGLALFVMPYYLLKAPMNRTVLVDDSGRAVGRLHVDVHLGNIFGHALLWLILSVLTLGLAYFLYWQSVMKRLLNGIVVQPL